VEIEVLYRKVKGWFASLPVKDEKRRDEIGAEQGEMNERDGMTVKTAGGTARVDRGEEKRERGKGERGGQVLFFMLFLLDSFLFVLGQALVGTRLV
jgi:hypothetical protein